MYQPSRPSTRAPNSAATSPRTNPLRSNNDRDRDEPSERRGPTYDPAGSIIRTGDSSSDLSGSQSMDERQIEMAKDAQKLNQIVTQFFIKGALTIVGSRANLPQAYTKTGAIRQNKWFNLCLDDSDELQSRLTDWRGTRLDEARPPPLIIEIYLDLEELTRSQSLVIIDEDGKRWDVAEALDGAVPSNARPNRAEQPTQVMLERWKIELGDFDSLEYSESETLANLYKKCVPVFRSLFYIARALPAWNFYRRNSKLPANSPALKLRYRVLNGRFKSPRKDTLDLALYPGDPEIIQSHEFGTLQSPAGPLQISVTYRRNCDVRIDDSESLLSSHFMAMDDRYFRPSIVGRAPETGAVPSSVPTSRRGYVESDQVQGQVYGSLSTFHQAGQAPGTSPISALRALRDVGSTSPPSSTPPQKILPSDRSVQGSKPALRQAEATPVNPRRTSVSFQPFKAGSLASSPASNLQVHPSPSSSLGRTTNLGPLTQPRNRNSLTSQTLPQAALRAPALPNETAITSSASSSPKPAPINRYSSSFSHRRSRFSSGGSKGDEDNNSSGKASASSSARQGSDVLNEPQAGSAGSMQQTDDDNLRDFISLLEHGKELKSFNRRDSASRDASMRRTTAALSKYQRMRESNAVLSDSLSSSLLLHRSSSSSSRQLSAVPPMIPGTSASTSSSPGKPVSPHTPHTPAIPSRLSVIEYGDGARRSRSRVRGREEDPSREEAGSDTTTRDTGTTAIDIPTSPRQWPYVRRSSSVGQQHHILSDDEPDLFGRRPASLPGADERTELTMSELLRVVVDGGGGPVAMDTEDRIPSGEQSLGADPADVQLGYPVRPESREESSTTSSTAGASGGLQFRSRIGYRGSHRGSPSFGSSGTATVAAGHSRYSLGGRASHQQQDDEEEFMFTMSEIGAGRRSTEEGRGGSSSGRARSGNTWS